MIRRKFLQFAALTGAASLAPFEAMAGASVNANAKTVVYQVKGFSCVTCAVGLDTIFSRRQGVLSSHSTYPEGKVTVRFDPSSIQEASLRSVITDAGFLIESERLAQ